MEDAGELDRLVKETLDAPTPSNFPPQFRKPKSEEFLKVGVVCSRWVWFVGNGYGFVHVWKLL